MLSTVLLFMCMILSILIIFSKRKEPFFETIQDYDYPSMYDFLVYDQIKHDRELSFLNTIVSSSSVVLDVGAGTGHHVNSLQKNNISAIGIDNDASMVKQSRKKYPHDYIFGDVLDTSMFPSESFTHILCLYYTLYYMKDKSIFFKNASTWLMPDGFLVVHVADEWIYGPTSTLKGAISYTSTLTHKKHREKISYKNKQIKRETSIYMEPVSTVVSIALQEGFTVYSMYHYQLPYKNQYIYVFKKNN